MEPLVRTTRSGRGFPSTSGRRGGRVGASSVLAVALLACTGRGTGAPPLVATTPEPPGANCAAGGVAIKSGLDTNGNGVLDEAEVTSTSYACNGPSGRTALVRVDVEPAGSNCAAGGLAVKEGLDSNHNEVLDDGEVTSTHYLCNGGPKRTPKSFEAIGTTTVCKTTDTFETVPDLRVTFTLDGTYVVLTEVDMTVAGPDSGWVSLRLAADGQPDPKWIHVQPQGATSFQEDDHMHLFRIDTLGAGAHTIEAQWGQGTGNMCSGAGESPPLSTRRLSAIAFPAEMGVQTGFVRGTTGQTHAGTPGSYQDIPELSLNVNLAAESIVLTQMDLNFAGSSGAWVATRLVVDAVADVRATHAQPLGGSDEEDALHLFRLDRLPPGNHSIKAQWGEGGGTVGILSDSTSNYHDRRLGFIAIPVSTGALMQYRNGTSDACEPANPAYLPIPDMSYGLSLTKQGWHLALTHFDFTLAPAGAGAAVAVRLNVDGAPDLRWTHAQPSASSEDDHLHLHRVDYLPQGLHSFQAEWGEYVNGGGCNYGNVAPYVWTRRLGTVIVPLEW